jgi:DNA polymerase-3 subunit beta
MKTIVKFEGQKNTIQGECRPKEAMEILGLNPKEWKVTSKEITEKEAVYTIERRVPFYVVPKTETENTEPALEKTPDEEPLQADSENNEPSPEKTEAPVPEPQRETTKLQTESIPPAPPVRLHVNRAALAECLDICGMITTRPALMPILGDVHIQSLNEETIRISATDLEVSYAKDISGKTDAPLDACIPCKVLLSEIKALPDNIESLELIYHENKLSVNGRCTLFCGDPEEFPEIYPVKNEIAAMKIDNLQDALKAVMPAISRDEARYSLTGARIDASRNKVIGTDGCRLHIEDIESDVPGPAVTVPFRTVSLLVKYGTDGLVIIGEDEKEASFAVNGGNLKTRLISGTFPDYENVWPDNSIKASFKTADILKLIQGAFPLSDTTGVSLTFNGDLEITSESKGTGLYQWKIPCDTTGVQGSMTVNFAPDFLVDAFKSYPAEVTVIEMPETYGACVINKKAVVMPRRI